MFHRVCTVTLRASQGRRFGETLQMMPPDSELMAAFRPDTLFYPRIKYLLQGESQHSLLQGLQAARLLLFFKKTKTFLITQTKPHSTPYGTTQWSTEVRL